MLSTELQSDSSVNMFKTTLAIREGNDMGHTRTRGRPGRRSNGPSRQWPDCPWPCWPGRVGQEVT